MLGLRTAVLHRFQDARTSIIVGKFGDPTGPFEVGNVNELEVGSALQVLQSGAPARSDYDELVGSEGCPTGQDDREFWQRVDARNRDTAALLDRLGLAEYFAMEAYVVRRGGAPIEPEMVATSSLAEKSPARPKTSKATAGR